MIFTFNNFIDKNVFECNIIEIILLFYLGARPSPRIVKESPVASPRFSRKPPVKEYTYRMPEVVYMKNDQKMELIEKPRKVIDDDMMYFCNQDDVDDNESYESLFEGFDGDVSRNGNTVSDSGLDQSESYQSERSETEDDRDKTSASECRKVEKNMDKLKLKLEKKMTGLTLQLPNDSESESGIEQSISETVEETRAREKEQRVRENVKPVVEVETEDVRENVRGKESMKDEFVQDLEKMEMDNGARPKTSVNVNTSKVERETDESGIESLRSEVSKNDVKSVGFELGDNSKAKKRKSHESVEQLLAS